MLEYKEYNDNELLYLICEQSEDAYEILCKKYMPIVEMKTNKYFKYAVSRGLDYNDLIQEGMIGLSEAIRDFKTQKDIKFSTFANLCIERQINTAIVRANRKKHKLLNESLSLDNTSNETAMSLMDIVFDKKENDPGEYLIDLESQTETYNKIVLLLTPFEKEVFDLKLNNFDYREIAKRLNKSSKSIDSALQRIKGKVKKILDICHRY
jgi:RNA polymerase sporulation-specific sigma factor